MSAKEKLVNVDGFGICRMGILIDPAGDSPIFNVTQAQVDEMRSKMGIVEPPFGSLMKLKEEGGEDKHERGK